MSNYKITDYSYNQAKKLNLIIKSSKNPKKKIDVYDKDNNFINSIGNSSYNDYPNYIKLYNLEYANKRRALYHNRHKKGCEIVNSKQYLAMHILW